MTTASAPGLVAGLFAASGQRPGQPDFVTVATDALSLDHSGIPGDLHHGPVRKAGAREPWLPRGATLRNDRQISALCVAELAEVAARLGIAVLCPEWIGGNLLVSGLPDFSRIAPGSRLAFGGAWGGKGKFDGGAVLRVEAYNLPCRQAGRAVATGLGQPALEFAFVKAAAAQRGLVLSVDLAGPVTVGDAVVVVPPVVPRPA